MRPRISVDLDKLVELHSKGFHDEIIAEKLGVSRPTIVRRRKELGLKANRKCGERGPGKFRENQPYYLEVRRIMRHVGKTIYSQVLKYIQETGDEYTAWAATIIDPKEVPHPEPGPFVISADNTRLDTVKYATECEESADKAGIAGVPGTAILELARIYKTANKETIEKLAWKAIQEAGYVGVFDTVSQVIKKGTTKVKEWLQIWEKRLQKSLIWAPVQTEKPRIFRFYCPSYYTTGTGKRGAGGGLQDIRTQTAWLGAGGY